MPFTVYRITSSSCPGKVYIGLTSKTLERRMRRHLEALSMGKKLRLYNSMRKYGSDTFSIEPLSVFATLADALAEERRLIAEVGGPDHPDVWNLTAGGEGMFAPSAEVREKIVKANKAAWSNPDSRIRSALADREMIARRNRSIAASHARPEWKAEFSMKMRQMHADPANKARHAAGLKSAYERPDNHARLVLQARRWVSTEGGLSQVRAAAAKASAARRRVYIAVSTFDPAVRLVFVGSRQGRSHGFYSGNMSQAAQGKYGPRGNVYKGYVWSYGTSADLFPQQLST